VAPVLLFLFVPIAIICLYAFNKSNCRCWRSWSGTSRSASWSSTTRWWWPRSPRARRTRCRCADLHRHPGVLRGARL